MGALTPFKLPSQGWAVHVCTSTLHNIPCAAPYSVSPFPLAAGTCSLSWLFTMDVAAVPAAGANVKPLELAEIVHLAIGQ